MYQHVQSLSASPSLISKFTLCQLASFFQLENGDALRITMQNVEQHAFTIYGGNRSFVVVASNAEEKQMWLEDINRAVMEAKESKMDIPHFPSLKSAGKLLVWTLLID